MPRAESAISDYASSSLFICELHLRWKTITPAAQAARLLLGRVAMLREPAVTPRVLIASSDEELRLRLRERLQGRGLIAVVAGDGPSIIDAINREQVDLVLLDADSLQPHACRVCRAIRRLNGGINLPILLFAEQQSEALIRRGFSAGANDVVWRPLTDSALAQRIRYLVRSADIVRQLATLVRASPDLVYRFVRRDQGFDVLEHEAVAVSAGRAQRNTEQFEQMMDLEAVAEVRESMHQALLTGRRQDVNFGVGPFPARRDYEMRLVAAGADEGLAFVRDVTARRRVEGLNTRLARALDQSSNSLLILNGETLVIEHANRSLVDSYGEQVTGRPVFDVLAPEHRAGLDEAIRQVSGAEGAEYAWSSVVCRSNGKRFPVDARIQAWHDEHGRILILNLQDATERTRQEARIRHLAYYDELTGLANRQFLREFLARAIARSTRDGRGVALLFLDLDRFKRINDTLGHAVGDLLLQHVAEQLKTCFRTEDLVSRIGMEDGATVARLGGDEFTIVLTDLRGREDAARVAERVIERLSVPVLLEGREVVVTPSIGIAVTPEAGLTPMALIKNADVAMYEAKKRGRNRYCFFEEGMADQTMARLDLEGALHRALQNHELRVFYQPQVRLDTGEIVGMEALMRWEHPQHGLIPPNHFIPLAEETGQIVPMGEWILRAAIKQAAVWRNAGMPVRVSVNVAVPQIEKGGFDFLVGSVLAEYGLPPGLLELELTETALVSEGEVVATLARLRQHGVCIAVDDFGTGYSSLAVLKRLPVDVVKIDRGFVIDADVNADDAAIVESIVSMAHTLGRDLVAEGVERATQADLLRRLRVQRAQGYLFYRPMPAADATRALATSQQQHADSALVAPSAPADATGSEQMLIETGPLRERRKPAARSAASAGAKRIR